MQFQGLSHGEKQINLRTFSINEAMATSWTVKTMRALVNERIGLANVRRQPEGVARNRTVYERVVQELRELGYESTW